MRNYDDLREMLCNELSDLYNETMKKGGASAAELDAIRDITSSIKNIWPWQFLCSPRIALCAWPLQP